MGTAIKHPVPDPVVICTFWHRGTLTLRSERQSAPMSKITNDGFTQSATGCFIAVPTWQQWASKGLKINQKATDNARVDEHNTSTRHARQADRHKSLTLCQLRPASAARRCPTATCRVVMVSKLTASERRRRQRQQAPTSALKHTSVGQRRAPVHAPSAAHQTVHDAAVAENNTCTSALTTTRQRSLLHTLPMCQSSCLLLTARDTNE